MLVTRSVRPCLRLFTTASASKMQIEVGERIPSAVFKSLELAPDGCTVGKPKDITSAELFDKKTVVLVAVPGAYTPTCTEKHIPGFVSRISEFKAKGVDTVACLSTNDAFVLAHWARDLKAAGKILFLSDGNSSFVNSIGMAADMSQFGMGMRSKRFAMVVKDGVIKYVAADSGPVLGSSAETVLANIK